MPVPNNPFQNPFYNRFNDPVTRRHDEMDAYAWLRTQHWSDSGNKTSESARTSQEGGNAPAGSSGGALCLPPS
jgi:hypothetical protein